VTKSTARSPITDSGETFGPFWKRARTDLRHNLIIGWPIFGLLGLYLVVSSLLLEHLAHLKDLGESFFLTWTIMTTLAGSSDVASSGGSITRGTKIVVSLDGLIGIVMIGTIVWLVTQSLTPTGKPGSRD
jgi:hypothetical protein